MLCFLFYLQRGRKLLLQLIVGNYSTGMIFEDMFILKTLHVIWRLILYFFKVALMRYSRLLFFKDSRRKHIQDRQVLHIKRKLIILCQKGEFVRLFDKYEIPLEKPDVQHWWWGLGTNAQTWEMSMANRIRTSTIVTNPAVARHEGWGRLWVRWIVQRRREDWKWDWEEREEIDKEREEIMGERVK